MLKPTVKRLFRFTLLKSVLVVSVLAILVLPLYLRSYAYPAFMKYVRDITEDESKRIARHLADMFASEGLRIEKEAMEKLAPEFEKVRADFGIVKIKVYDPLGIVVYSTEPKDIGVVHGESFFHEKLAAGKTITEMVRKDTETLEGEIVGHDVVETYIPMMSGDGFTGAFEIYYDATDRMAELNRLVHHADRMLFVFTMVLFGAVLVNYLRARGDIMARMRAEEQVGRQTAEMKRRNEELSLLFNISAAISRKLDLDELLKLVLDLVTEPALLGVEKRGGVFLVEGEDMRLAAHLGHTEEFIRLHDGMKVGDCLCGQAAKTGELIVSKDSSIDRRHGVKAAGLKPHGHIVVPLKAMEKLVGVLYLYLPPYFEVEERGLHVLMSIGGLVGVAIENARRYEGTKELSLQDPLTGLANRRLMEIVLENSFARAVRYGSPLFIAMVDIDYFKKYNDTHGHAAGDKLLQEVAEILKHSVRAVDLVARYGGEEFLILIHETSFEQSCAVVERIRGTVEQSTPATVSIGLAAFRAGMKKGEAVEMADDALYRAKEGGRNRVVCV